MLYIFLKFSTCCLFFTVICKWHAKSSFREDFVLLTLFVIRFRILPLKQNPVFETCSVAGFQYRGFMPLHKGR